MEIEVQIPEVSTLQTTVVSPKEIIALPMDYVVNKVVPKSIYNPLTDMQSSDF